jgi:hypothetical protein
VRAQCDARKVYKNSNDHKPRPMRIENGVGLKSAVGLTL